MRNLRSSVSGGYSVLQNIKMDLPQYRNSPSASTASATRIMSLATKAVPMNSAVVFPLPCCWQMRPSTLPRSHNLRSAVSESLPDRISATIWPM